MKGGTLMQISDIKRMAYDILTNQSVENSYIEYKKSAQFKDKILKTACAFANNYMNNEIGLIFIGVEEVNDISSGEKAIPKRPICGIKESLLESTENDLKSLLAHIHPKITYHLIQDRIDDANYLIIAIEPGSNGPYQTSEKAERSSAIKLKSGRYIRIQRDSKLPNFTEEFELLKKFANFSFSSNLNETATLDDLNYEYMKEYLVQTGAKEDIRNLSKLDMAKSMGLISESEYGGYRAKNFAVLMFANRPNQFIPNAHVEVIREIKGTDRMEAKRFDGPIWIQAQQLSRYFQDMVMTSYTIRTDDKIEHEIIYNYPLIAFEELATNAILHKEYDTPEYVGIYVYQDCISIVNHNRPLPPVTIETLNTSRRFDKRQYVNPQIKDMFYSLNLIESYGSGIRRAKDALLNNGSPELLFLPDNDVDNYTNVIMRIQPEFLEETAYAYKKVKRHTPTVNEKLAIPIKKEMSRKKTSSVVDEILYLMKSNPQITAVQIAEALGSITAAGVRYNIANLKAKGVIERAGSTKAGTWVVLKDL